MILVTVARKPLSEGTVAANVLKYGTGALNINAGRISTALGDETTSHVQGKDAANSRHTLHPSWRGIEENYQTDGQKLGRWPANLILEHRPGCRKVGAIMVSGDGHWPSSRGSGSEVSGPSGHKGQEGLAEKHATSESVPVWECEIGCPAADLDRQSGNRPGMSGGGDQGDNKKTGNEVIPSFNRKPSAPFLRGDTGGASRFFKQVGGQK